MFDIIMATCLSVGIFFSALSSGLMSVPAQGLGGQKFPLESRSETPVRDLGDEVPRNQSSLQTLFTDFDCINR